MASASSITMTDGSSFSLTRNYHEALLLQLSRMCDTFDRIANEAGNIVKYNKRSTMDARAVQCTYKVVMPGELHRVSG